MRIDRITGGVIEQGKDLLRRVRLTEGMRLSDAEIRMLRLQLHLLDIELSNSIHTNTPSVMDKSFPEHSKYSRPTRLKEKL